MVRENRRVPINNCQDCEQEYQKSLVIVKNNPEKYELTNISEIFECEHKIDRQNREWEEQGGFDGSTSSGGVNRGALRSFQWLTCQNCQEKYLVEKWIGKTVFYKTKDHVCKERDENSSPNNQKSPFGEIGRVIFTLLVIFLVYLILLVRKYFKNHCVKCGKQFWTWNIFDGRKACFACRRKIDEKVK